MARRPQSQGVSGVIEVASRMNKPPDDLRGNWSAELEVAETWRDIGKHDSWWEAGMALINEELTDWRSIAKQHHFEDRSHDDEIVPSNTKINVAIVRRPREPETLIDADDILEKIVECDHDDYCMECAEGYLHSVPKDAKESLTEMLRKTLARWLDRHGLRPTWFVVERYWTVTAGQIRQKAREMGVE